MSDLLPTFCNDPSRSWDAAGFKEDWVRISEVDAADFLRGIDGELVRHEGRGLYRAPMSSASEQFFWSGAKNRTPRPITLWLEPIITVAVLARLHFDLGWPKELIGTQSNDWAFDVVTYLSSSKDSQHISCEIKKSATETVRLIEHMDRFGKLPNVDQKDLRKTERNSLRKLEALRHRRPPLFWAAGPGGSGHAFKVEYSEDKVSFREIGLQKLGYQRSLSA